MDSETQDADLDEYERLELEAYLFEGWKRFESCPEHWVHGADESLSYCFECCEKEVARLKAEQPEGDFCVDGGWGGGESDITPFCETCGKLLESCLTGCGCEEEIEHFETNGFDCESDEDRRALYEVVSSMGWSSSVDPGEIYQRLHKLGRSILDRLHTAADAAKGDEA